MSSYSKVVDFACSDGTSDGDRDSREVSDTLKRFDLESKVLTRINLGGWPTTVTVDWPYRKRPLTRWGRNIINENGLTTFMRWAIEKNDHNNSFDNIFSHKLIDFKIELLHFEKGEIQYQYTEWMSILSHLTLSSERKWIIKMLTQIIIQL